MDCNDLMRIAETLNASLKSLKARNLHLSAFFYSASDVNPSKLPDRIVVERIKCLHRTGRFTADDRAAANRIICQHCDGLDIKVLDNDWAMHNAVITLKV